MSEKQQSALKRLLKVKEAASYLGVSVGKLRRFVHGGDLPYIQTESPGPWLLDIRDLDAFIESQKQTR